MTAFAFLMTFLVGIFCGVTVVLLVGIHLDNKQQRAMNQPLRRPSKIDELPFNVEEIQVS